MDPFLEPASFLPGRTFGAILACVLKSSTFRGKKEQQSCEREG